MKDIKPNATILYVVQLGIGNVVNEFWRLVSLGQLQNTTWRMTHPSRCHSVRLAWASWCWGCCSMSRSYTRDRGQKQRSLQHDCECAVESVVGLRFIQ